MKRYFHPSTTVATQSGMSGYRRDWTVLSSTLSVVHQRDYIDTTQTVGWKGKKWVVIVRKRKKRECTGSHYSVTRSFYFSLFSIMADRVTLMKRIKSCFGNTKTMVSLLEGHVLKGDVRGKKKIKRQPNGDWAKLNVYTQGRI